MPGTGKRRNAEKKRELEKNVSDADDDGNVNMNNIDDNAEDMPMAEAAAKAQHDDQDMQALDEGVLNESNVRMTAALANEMMVRLGDGAYVYDEPPVAPSAGLAGHKRLRPEDEEDEDMDFEAI